MHEFNPLIYPRKVWVMIASNERFLNDTFNHGYNIENFAQKSTAIVFPCELKKTGEYGVAVVFTRKKHMTLKTICHESVHVASCIFNECNIRMGFSDCQDEHYAYLVGWVAESINEVKRMKK